MLVCAAYETVNIQQIEMRNITVDESPVYEVIEGQHGEEENDSDVYENITQL